MECFESEVPANFVSYAPTFFIHLQVLQILLIDILTFQLQYEKKFIFKCIFQRLSTANEEIIEVLLSKQQLLPALRYALG